MKLDHRQTILVGLAFLSISAFWQMYDNIVPLIEQIEREVEAPLSALETAAVAASAASEPQQAPPAAEAEGP